MPQFLYNWWASYRKWMDGWMDSHQLFLTSGRLILAKYN